MGTRSTIFKCESCGNEWWEKFEHLTREELTEFVEETECPECESSDWVVTYRSAFAGGPIQPNPPEKEGERLRHFTCDDCPAEFYAWLPELAAGELVAQFDGLSCPDCGSENWELRDGYKFVAGRNPVPPSYVTVVNERTD